jgi:arylsulfatase A-like enzyme
MTGCYNVRVGIQGWLRAASDHGIHADEMTLAEVVKQQGYASACYGKWHLGHHPKFLPTSQGFDEFFGIPWSNNMRPLPFMEGTRVSKPTLTEADRNNFTALCTQRAVRFIESNKSRPFLLYLPHAMVHVPLNVSDRFRGKSERGLFGDVVAELDWSVGQIFETLRACELQNDTFVLFTSDNGPWLRFGDHAGSAAPLREGKGAMFDGGCREPTIMWWPGKIPAGTVCRTPAMTIDLLPTIAHLIGAELSEHAIDGKNIWPLIADAPGAKSPHQAYFFYYGEQLQAVRMGRWKLHFPHDYPTLNGRAGGAGGKPVPVEQAHIDLALFDLEQDPGETVNVLEQHPDVVAKIKKLADDMRAELGDSATGQKGAGMREPGRVQQGDMRFDWDPEKPIRVDPRLID